MNIDVFNTHIEIYPYTKGDLPGLEDMYTAEDYRSKEKVPCGYIIDNGRLYVPRGTSVSKIEMMTGTEAEYIDDSDPSSKMRRAHHAIYDPRNEVQEQSIDFLIRGEGRQLALNLATGVGKAELNSRKIPTPDGYKLMGDIEVGDFVFGSDGRPTKVLGVFPQGEVDIYQVAFSDGRIAKCSGEHLWGIYNSRTGSYCVKETQYIMEDYKLPNGNSKYSIPQLVSPVKYDEQPVLIDPYVFGALIGNTFLHNGHIIMTAIDQFVPSKVAKLCKCKFKKIANSSMYVFTEMSDDLINKITEFVKYCKGIPGEYLYNSEKVRLNLLRGLLDSDGDIIPSDGQYLTVYHSHNPILLDDIKELALGLGFHATIRSNNEDGLSGKKFTGYIKLTLRNSQKYKLFTHPKKKFTAIEARFSRLYKRLPELMITDIKPIGRGQATCIMVESPDHLYVTEDFLVTHNTFCVAHAITQLGIKAMIITHSDSIKHQWIKTFKDMMDFRSSDLCNITGSNVIEGLMNDYVEPADVYFINHQTLRNFLFTHGAVEFHNFFKKIKIGIKAYDESHLNFGNILMIDSFSNTNATWYISATFDRSDKSESACFRKAFQTVIPFGEEESKKLTKKHIEYFTVNIHSHPTQFQTRKVIPFQGMSAATYGRYAFLEDKNETAYNAIKMILEKIKDIDGKILIFIPLIEAVDYVTAKLKKDFDNKTIAAYHSRVSRDEKENATERDIIVSTIKSCGTGRDIPGLKAIICAEPIASKVQTQQLLGRIRPIQNGDVPTYFFDIVDRAFAPINWWWKSRMKKVEVIAKSVSNLQLE